MYSLCSLCESNVEIISMVYVSDIYSWEYDKYMDVDNFLWISIDKKYVNTNKLQEYVPNFVSFIKGFGAETWNKKCIHFKDPSQTGSQWGNVWKCKEPNPFIPHI